MQGNLVQVAQVIDLIVEVQALELVSLGERQLFIGIGGQQPGQFVSPDFLRQYQPGQLFLQVYRLAEVEQGENQRRVFGFPVLRLVARVGDVGFYSLSR